MLSIIVPARNEPYLVKTIHDIFEKVRGEIQVIALLENFWPPEWDKTADKYVGKLITVHHGSPRGMRYCINEGVAISSGEWLMKTDAHCAFKKGFDVQLVSDCDKKTVMIPRRYRLDPEKWARIRDGRPPVDYEYLTPPDASGGGLKGKLWERPERKGIQIDETMLAQGSCWFMHREYFRHLDLMDEEHYGKFWKEMMEIALKAWLSGGRVVTNKKTWYAHWHKDRRGYTLESEEQKKAHEFCQKWLTDSAWKKQTLPFKSLIERFNPPGWENYAHTA